MPHLEIALYGVNAVQVVIQGDGILVQDHMRVQDVIPAGQIVPRESLVECLAGAQQSLLL